MTIRLSTALRNARMDNAGIRSTMANGKIKLFTGPQPVSADAAEQGTLIMEITIDAGAFTHGSPTNGINFGAPVSGALSKASAETWRGLAIAAGTVGWFRFVANPSDAGASSTSLARIDGTVGTTGSGADMILSQSTYIIGQPCTIDTFTLTDPA